MSAARLRCAPSTWDLPFFFDPVHHELAEQARRVAMRGVAPEEDAAAARGPQTLEAEHARCREVARTLAVARLLEVCVPASVGGLTIGHDPNAVDVRAVCVVREMLGWASGLADTVFAMQGLGSYPLVLAGSDAQRREFLPPVVEGRSLAAFAITEPEAGSDVAGLATRAVRDGDGYVLDGVKTFISNAGVAGHYVVFATVDPALGRKGITAFVVRPEDRGFIFESPLHLIAEHPIGTIRFDGLRVPVGRRLGAEGEGFRIAMGTLDVFRPTVGAAAIGMARRALDEALARATTRTQFGQTLAEFQTTQVYLAEMATDLDAARLLVYRAAHLKDHGAARVTLEASMGKLFSTEAAQRVIDRALQLHGGLGVVRGHPVERLYREVRALRIYEGTTEIQRVVIAGQLIAGERARAEQEHTQTRERAEMESGRPSRVAPPPPAIPREGAAATRASDPPAARSAKSGSADTTRRLRSAPPPPPDKKQD